MKNSAVFLTVCILIIGALSTPTNEEGENKNLISGVKGVTHGVKSIDVPKLLKKVAAKVSAVNGETENKQEQVDSEQTELTLLSKEIKIQNQAHVFVVPNDWKVVLPEHTFLSVTFKIDSEEDVLGFDEPAFLISINDEPVYQLSRVELSVTDWQTRQFIIDVKKQPTYISIWAGNTGDDEKPTTATIKDIHLFKGMHTKDVYVGKPDNLHLTKDNEIYSTIEWTAPTVMGKELDKALRYEFKYSHYDNPSEVDWLQLPSVDVLLPSQAAYLAKSPPHSEELLIKNNPSYTYLLLRAIDWQGNYGAVASVALTPNI